MIKEDVGKGVVRIYYVYVLNCERIKNIKKNNRNKVIVKLGNYIKNCFKGWRSKIFFL